MLFVADQHHMDELEQRVLKDCGRDYSIRLLGDMTPTSIIEDPKETTTYLKLRRFLTIEKKKKEDPKFGEPELSAEAKMEADREGILSLNEEGFNKWVCFYGAASISNLARKYFIHSSAREKVLCLNGSEPIVDNAQRTIFERLKSEKQLSDHSLTEFLLSTMKARMPEMYGIISRQLGDSGIKGDISEFIFKELALERYGGNAPLASDVFRGYPSLDRFEFRESISWEKVDNCVIVYIPVINSEKERDIALRETMQDLARFLSEVDGHVVIASHINPYPIGMKDASVKLKKHRDTILVEDAVWLAFATIAKKRKLECSVVCGHLHSSNSSYDWPLMDLNKKQRLIKVHPLGIKDIALLDTKSGPSSIRVRQY